MAPDSSTQQNGATRAGFPTTCWTVISELKPGEDPVFEKRALEALCKTYWFPLYAFARHRGMKSHDAEDAVQSFFMVIAGAEYFRKADHSKGKLRTFILTGFTRHLKDLKVHANAKKRGGGAPALSIDTNQAEEWLVVEGSAQKEDETLNFEHHWAKNIVRVVIETLRKNAEAKEQSRQRFAILSRFIDPGTMGEMTIQQAADELKLSLSACEKAIQRLRHEFRLTIREQVAATLRNPDENTVISELQQLQKALSSSSSH